MGKITSLLGYFLTISFYKNVMPTVRRSTYNYTFNKVCSGAELRSTGDKQTYTTNPVWLRPIRCVQKPVTDSCSVSRRPALAYVDIMDSELFFKILTFYFPNKEKENFCLIHGFLKRKAPSAFSLMYKEQHWY